MPPPRAAGSTAPTAPRRCGAATSQEIQRRARLTTRVRVAADAEVWLAPEDFEQLCELARRVSDLIHERARAPHADGTVHGSVSVFAFELGA